MGGVIGAIRPGENFDYKNAIDLIKHRIVNTTEIGNLKNGFLQGNNHNGDYSQPWRRGNSYLVGDFDIFNFKELIKNLECEGISFDNQCVGEILLASWEVWGERIFKAIEGDFALALYDDKRGILILARDRVGARPLYYSCVDDQIYFASEYKSILGMWGKRLEVDLDVVQNLQSKKTVPADTTFIKGIYQVPPQNYLKIRKDGEKLISNYWEPKLNLKNHSFSKHCENLKKTFLAAIEKRISKDSPVVISLSGGVDSIAIVGGVRELFPDVEIHTLTVANSDSDQEKVWAEKVAYHFGTIHKTLVIAPETIKTLLPVLVWHLEDPIARTETLMSYVLAKEASKISNIIFRGDGADGLFGGMPRHNLVAKTEKFPIIKPLVDQLYGFNQTGLIPGNFISRAAFNLFLRRRIPRVPSIKGASPIFFETHLPETDTEILNHLLVNGPKLSLPNLLQKIERMHSAFGVRCISPFLDSKVMKVASQIPSRYKNDGKQGKIVFREAIKSFVPLNYVDRPKHPQRLQESNKFCDTLFEIACILFNQKSVERRDIFNWQEISILLKRRSRVAWKPEHAMRIWTLILTEIWFLTFFDQTIPKMINFD